MANESSMIAVADGLAQQKLLSSVKIWQLDDWWYPGEKSIYVHCVRNWTLGQPAFSRSLGALSKRVQTPWLLYVPFFCPENVYTSKYKFVHGAPSMPGFAEPDPADGNALAFYRELFDYGIANGMAGFENDFLNYNLLAVPHFRTSFNASTGWLAAMNAAALERRLPVQMCMALPSDLMASVALHSVGGGGRLG